MRSACRWYEKAAEQGLVEAHVAIGDIYATGQGRPRDASLAREWYAKAAAQGNKPAAGKLRRPERATAA